MTVLIRVISNHKTVQVNILLNKKKYPTLIFSWICLDNTEHSSIKRENKRTEIGKERTVKGEDCKIVNVYRQRRGKKEKEKQEDLM